MKKRDLYFGVISQLFLWATSTAYAQNPVISGQFTADPTARVFDGKLYLYPSHDIVSPVPELEKWFCMEDYHVFSTDNLTEWKDHGMIITQNRVPWVKPGSYAMWAPECVCKDGKYYFYFPAQLKSEEKKTFGVGVAVSDQPTGPFMPMSSPIEGIKGIDPCVFTDKDGQSYIYWAGGKMLMAKLKDNMRELASEPVEVGGLPDGFKEGPFVFERAGKYYYTFPWVSDKTETLAYSMGDSPEGPFEFKGIIMDQSPTECWTNHHSIVEYKDQWYLFYHHNDYSPHFDKNRSVRIDSLSFNEDGTINKVTPTLRGVGLTDARSRIQIDRYSDKSATGVSIAFLDDENRFEGWKSVFSKRNGRISYNNVDFGEGGVKKVSLMARSATGGEIEITAKGDGKNKIASIPVKKSDDWQIVSMPVKSSPSGINDIDITMTKGGNIEIDWIGFDELPWDKGALVTGQYRNMLAEAGYTSAEIETRLNQIFQSLFYGPDKVYFEVGDSMAYMSDIKNKDVRTEGMSYGMMIAVQLDKKDIFDRLWRWSRTYMQHQSGPRKGYFAWSCKVDGTPNSMGSASDGELFYITSLIFASNRWGNDTGINYKDEARAIIDNSMQKCGMNMVAPLINPVHKLITFTPDPWGSRFTDPSYHIPAFYEVWAKWADDGRSGFWKECARASREYLRNSIHPVTGLTPDYNNYDGTLLGSEWIIGDAFRFDSWRVPMNIAIDYSWSCEAKEWQSEYGDKIQSFLYGKGLESFADQYNVDGSDVTEILEAGEHKSLRHSLGLVATSAAVSTVCKDTKSREFIEHFMNAKHEPYQDGYFDAYYDGLLRLFAFMHLSGNYRVIEPR